MKHFLMVRSAFIIAAIFVCVNNYATKRTGPQFFQNIINVTVDVKGQSFIGNESFDMEGLAHELQQRFWKSYLGTGKMQDEVKLEFTGNVSTDIQKQAIAAIKKGQQNALIDLCLQLHKKKFEDLSPKQKQKIKTKYPILFQQKF